jgi:hypothetical protein
MAGCAGGRLPLPSADCADDDAKLVGAAAASQWQMDRRDVAVSAGHQGLEIKPNSMLAGATPGRHVVAMREGPQRRAAGPAPVNAAQDGARAVARPGGGHTACTRLRNRSSVEHPYGRGVSLFGSGPSIRVRDESVVTPRGNHHGATPYRGRRRKNRPARGTRGRSDRARIWPSRRQISRSSGHPSSVSGAYKGASSGPGGSIPRRGGVVLTRAGHTKP